jgi:outer membrane protein assembly factor BamB
MLRYAWCFALALTGAPALAGPFDWPQWQGPDRNAVSKETGLLKEWPKDGPPLAWKVKGLGGGYSAPSVAGGRIFGLSNRGSDEVVWALSEADGKEQWVTRLGPPAPQRMPQGREGPRCTPTVDGERLYVLGLGGDLACLEARDGKVVWQRSLTRDFGGRVPRWSYRESPLVDGDKVICTPGGPDTTLVALDKRTGKTVWKSPVPGSLGGPTLRPSPSTSAGSASTCSSRSVHSSGSRPPTGSSSGGTTSPPTARALTVPRRSTTTGWCSPPRPTARAAGW